jgi:hypothetical protein
VGAQRGDRVGTAEDADHRLDGPAVARGLQLSAGVVSAVSRAEQRSAVPGESGAGDRETWNDGGKGAPVFFDEFASLVHDQVAKIASAAVSKAVRQMKRQLVAVTWRTDILESLEPDWVIFCGSDQSVRLELNAKGDPGGGFGQGSDAGCADDSSPWALFKGHHYLSGRIEAAGAEILCGLVEGQPAAFTAAITSRIRIAPKWREHRTVCLPDFQGVGIGNAMSEYDRQRCLRRWQAIHQHDSTPGDDRASIDDRRCGKRFAPSMVTAFWWKIAAQHWGARAAGSTDGEF